MTLIFLKNNFPPSRTLTHARHKTTTAAKSIKLKKKKKLKSKENDTATKSSVQNLDLESTQSQNGSRTREDNSPKNRCHKIAAHKLRMRIQSRSLIKTMVIMPKEELFSLKSIKAVALSLTSVRSMTLRVS